MATTTRRYLLKAAAFGGVSATGLAVLGANGETAAAAEQKPGNGNEHAHDNRPMSGNRALAVVSFGQWDTQLDRQPVNTETENRTRNIHLMLPFEAEIDAGGAVSFIISGVHQILIYGPDIQYLDLKADWMAAGSPVLPPVPPAGPGLVDYAPGRVYRGMNPFVLQYLPLAPAPPDTANNMVVDRIETVRLKDPGRYLVACGVVPHFNGEMFGYVNVKA